MRSVQLPDTFTARGRPGKPQRYDGIVLFAFMFLSCALLVFSRLDLEPLRWLRWQIVATVTPALEVASPPLAVLRQAMRRVSSSLDAISEIEQLRRENHRLRQLEARTRELERKLAQVTALARVAEDIGTEFVTARIMADAKGPFTSSVLVNLGARDGVKHGFAAVTGDGFVGHVVDVGERAARVLLAGDANSRIPVIVGPSAARAILKGNGSEPPRLTHVAGTSAHNVALRDDDDVFTSGDEGMLPRGLKIGVVRMREDGPRVRLAADPRNTDFVNLIFFNPPPLASVSDGATAERREPVSSGKLEPTSARHRAGAAR